MNAVVCYSNTGQSLAIASHLADRLGYALSSIEEDNTKAFLNLVLVFPVYCQNIPDAVKEFLGRINVKNLTVIATYGKMCCGNVLFEIQKRYQKNIVAGAYIPTKHTYIEDDDAFCDYDKLAPLIEKIREPSYIRLPRLYKNPLAGIFPKLRSRLGLKIEKSENCDGCDLCEKKCSLGAIRSGTVNGKCIRCLKCVNNCPKQAIKVKLSLPLRLYLNKKKTNKTIIYV